MVLSANVRKIIYYVAIALAVAGFVTGVVTPEQVNDGVATAAQLVATIAGILALLNITPDAPTEQYGG